MPPHNDVISAQEQHPEPAAHVLEYLHACAQAFDTMLLLKRGGEVIYNGPLGFQSRDMISYFESIPGEARQ